MPGIFGNNINSHINIMEQENRIYKNLSDNYWYLELSGIKKFENDKTLYNDGNYLILIDGVILNLSSLKKEYNANDIEELTIKMYEKEGEQFFNIFRGNFCGFFRDKKSNKILIFTNHTGDKTIFYYHENNNIIFASEIKHILKCMQKNNLKYSIDKRGIYCMLTYAYMYDNLTLVQEIKRLLPGNYIKIQNGDLEILEYYKLSNKVIENNETEEQIMANIEEKFKKAVELQVNKNKEYGYTDIAPLSAGLDSRMTNYMIKKISSNPIYNITYSQTGQLDEITPAKIAEELKNHWIFKNLNNGLALYFIDESLKFSDGIIYYVWPSQLYDFMKIINNDNLGIVHTGVIGDAVLGTFFKGEKYIYNVGDGAYSKKLISKLIKILDVKNYDNYEIGMFYNRAFNGAVLGYSMVFQNYTEAISPFMNTEFMNYCLSLPLKYRKRHDIYYKWVNKYHPNASKYSHNGVKIPKKSKFEIKIKGNKYSISSILSICGNKLRNRFNRRNNDMNPIQQWYDNNEELRNKMDMYFKDNIYLMSKYQDIKLDMEELYNLGTAMEKSQVITILSFMKKYFKNI